MQWIISVQAWLIEKKKQDHFRGEKVLPSLLTIYLIIWDQVEIILQDIYIFFILCCLYIIYITFDFFVLKEAVFM